MPHYLTMVSYASEGWAAVVAHPQDRLDVIKSSIEKLGGKVVTGWFAFGEYDVISILEMPDNIAAAAIAIAFAAGGACKNVRTVPLLSREEAMQALRKAGECGYRPPKAA